MNLYAENEDEEATVNLSASGWTLVEVAERMVSLEVPVTDICTALDLSHTELRMLLTLAAAERVEIANELSNLSF